MPVLPSSIFTRITRMCCKAMKFSRSSDTKTYCSPTLIGRVGLQRRIESQYFKEIETDTIRASHGQDGAAVALQRAQAGLAQPPPGFAGRGVENDSGATRAGTARLQRVLAQRPRESEPARVGSVRLAGFMGLRGKGRQREKNEERYLSQHGDSRISRRQADCRRMRTGNSRRCQTRILA